MGLVSIDEKCFLETLALCREVKQRFWKCTDECIANSGLSLVNCYDICEEEVRRRYGLSVVAMKKCIRE